MKLNDLKLGDLDLNKLHVFRTVAESRSMREAGEKLLRTPGAVSQSVSGLEAALGLRLFDRIGVRLKLTAAGQRLLAQTRDNERALQDLLSDLRGTEQLKGRVQLGLPFGYPAASLPPGLAEALLNHPALQLRLRFLVHRRLAQSLNSGQLDIALSLQPLRRFGARIRSQKARAEELVLVLPPRYRAQAEAGWEEIPVVDYYQAPLLMQGWLKHHGQRKAGVEPRVFGANLEHVLAMVRKGVGGAVVPRHIVEQELAAGELLLHPWDRKNPWRVDVWVNTRGTDLTPAAGVFLAAFGSI